jgi:hypothetical protein
MKTTFNKEYKKISKLQTAKTMFSQATNNSGSRESDGENKIFSARGNGQFNSAN